MGIKMGWTKLGAGALLVVAGAISAGAEPLAKEVCETLAGEQQALIANGTKADFAKGAAWGKANLAADRLKQVGRYIDVEEQLSFRCGLARVRFSLPADEETPVVEEPEVPQKKATPQVKPAPKAKAKAATADEGTTQGERPKATPKVQAKIKPAAKAGDAEPATAKDE